MTFQLHTPAGSVSAEYTLPADHAAGRAGVLVLAHGAGSDMHHAALVDLGQVVAAAGTAVCRFNFPYREAGRRIPDRLPVLVTCYRAIVEHVRSDPTLDAPWIVIGGRSMGGRVASHLAADGLAVRGLLFLAFPLHPAGRPGTARAAHLAAIGAPMLFVQGTRDALATWELLEPLVCTLPTATLHRIDGADHALAVPKRQRPSAVVVAEVHETVVAWLADSTRSGTRAASR